MNCKVNARLNKKTALKTLLCFPFISLALTADITAQRPEGLGGK